MSDELDNKIKQISEIFGQQGNEENIKKVLQMLSSASNTEESRESNSNSQNSNSQSSNHQNSNHQMFDNSSGSRQNIDNNLEMVRKAKTILDTVNSSKDSRVNLLNAIMPFLNNTRRDKCNKCINLLRMSSMAKIFTEMEKGK